ncbi:odorant-binding protein-like [Choloepus didactylus]|uniref:odorant-binding protein-like n=1 Tax=Choloepus didactylus TaxID=27675 RepID=UPI0018A0FB18|nr:odorant-binding protein-like [Choloepus didactylus]
MKILLLTPLLALVVANQKPPSVEELSKFSGPWNLIFVAANNKEKLDINGPFRTYICNIEFKDKDGMVIFKYYSVVNGKCIGATATRKKTGNSYEIEYAGKTLFQVIYATKAAVIARATNVDEEGLVTKMTEIFGDILQHKYFFSRPRSGNTPPSTAMPHGPIDFACKNPFYLWLAPYGQVLDAE